MKRNRWFGAVLLLAMVSIAASVMLALIHFQLVRGETSPSRVCTFSERISCEAVAASRFSELLGIPIALWGIATYIVILALALLGLTAGEGQKTRAATYLFLISLWCVVYSAFLAGISFFSLHVTCLFCDILYLTNILLVVVSWRLSERSLARILRFVWDDALFLWRRKWVFAALVAVLVMTASAVSYRQILHRRNQERILQERIHQYLANYRDLPVQRIPLRDSPDKGNRGAKVVIHEFSDFECPFCRRAHEIIQDIVKKYKGRVQVVWKDFPLDNKCNPSIRRSFHEYACLAAAAARCAHDQGAFWEYSDILFSHQKDLNPAHIRRYADWLRLDSESFDLCLQNKDTQERILQDIMDGFQVQVSSTPTFFINGKMIKGALPEEVFEAIIEYELAR